MKHYEILQLFAQALPADASPSQSGEAAAPQAGQEEGSGLPWKDPAGETLTDVPSGGDTPSPDRLHRSQHLAQAEMTVRQHIQDLDRQGRELAQLLPGFDLRRELQDPVFARLVAPGSGVGVKQAYFALHQEQLQTQAMETAARITAQKLTNAFRSGGLRPRETGADGQAAPVAPADYRQATRQQREALKKRIRAAAARGEKLYPGE